MDLATSDSACIIGIDLAWGDARPDGVCVIRANRELAKISEVSLTKGDDSLLQWLSAHVPRTEPTLLAIDAPLIVPNSSGCRPVDRQISVNFGKYHAACHSANSNRCARPLRLVSRLRANGYLIDFDLRKGSRIATEVYPHPAMIRLFEIDRIVKYKKGRVAVRREEFARLRELVRSCLQRSFPEVAVESQVDLLLQAPWSKDNEDKIDALFCALIGYQHWRTHGAMCDVVGTLEGGFILLPSRQRNGFPLMRRSSTGATVTMELVNKLRDQNA